MADFEQRDSPVRRRGVHDGHADDEGIPLDDGDWVEGGMPRQSYASPWTVASPKHAAIVRRQGRLNESFVRTVVDALETYLESPTEE